MYIRLSFQLIEKNNKTTKKQTTLAQLFPAC